MKSFAVAALAAAVALTAVPAQAALVADYQLNGSLADALGGPDLTNNGGVLGPNGINFGVGEGPSLGGFANTSVYSVEIGFSFDNVDGYRRILDFQNQTSDSGFYVLSGFLNFYPVVTAASADFVPGVQNTVLFTRDAAGNATGYVNGTARIDFVDSSNLAVIANTLIFFNDDFLVPNEQSAGFVDFIRIYDTAIVPGVVPGVPEPAAWALLIAGFAMTGTAMRRRAAAIA